MRQNNTIRKNFLISEELDAAIKLTDRLFSDFVREAIEEKLWRIATSGNDAAESPAVPPVEATAIAQEFRNMMEDFASRVSVLENQKYNDNLMLASLESRVSTLENQKYSANLVVSLIREDK